jgi:predicted membrane-bound spermidine synthase
LRQPAKALLMAELALSYLGPLAPILILFMDWILRREIGAGGASYHLMLQSFVYLMIFVIGILSGLELPVLMSLGESLCELRSGAVLGLDYLGTLVAVAIFPLWGLGQLGLFGTAALAGLMTCSGAILTFWALPAATRPRWLLLSLVPALILVLGLLVFSDEVTTYLSHTIFLVAQ